MAVLLVYVGYVCATVSVHVLPLLVGALQRGTGGNAEKDRHGG
jgi:hypothetical protein